MSERTRILHASAFAVAMVAAMSDADAATLVDCRFNGGNGDNLSRAFYVTDYRGVTVDRVTLGHRASAVAGDRTIVLTMRLNTYNGPVLGTVARRVSLEVGVTTPTIFNFEGIRVTPGSRLAFTQEVTQGDDQVSFDVGAGPCDDITETNGSSAPLDSFRRNTVGVMITGSPADLTDVVTFSCPYNPEGAGDGIERGFYVTRYPGKSMRRVSLRLRTSTPGGKTLLLTARSGAYDGPELGSAGLVVLNMGTSTNEFTFNFGNVPVPAGSTIAFTLVLGEGADTVFLDGGFAPCLDAIETQGTTPPLDTLRRESMGIRITGDVASAAPIEVVEYFHAGFGHYFMTALPAEIALLDGGGFGGAFARTGSTFKVYDGPANGAVAVCRFFTVTFAPKSSHFYTEHAGECSDLQSNPNWQFETVAFYAPPPVAGSCPVGTKPVYRIYNSGIGGAPNHRFTTSLAVYSNFINGQGWTGEGIRFCAVGP